MIRWSPSWPNFLPFDINQYVEVQPGDGFGTLLPFEKLEIDVIFNPRKAGEYTFELTCKTAVDR